MKQIVLDRLEHRGEFRFQSAGDGHGDADAAIEFVDRAIGFDARGILLHALAAAESGAAVVAGAGVNFGQAVASHHSSVNTLIR